jgi:hypothetical protein
MALTWRHPFTCLITGPTSCGKTQFTLRLLRYAKTVIQPSPQKIVWCYGVYQTAFDALREDGTIEFREGLPNPESFDGRQRTLLIIDDLMSETDDRVTKIFTKISHHMDVSVIYLTQNLFFAGKHNRTIGLNSHYLVIFKNPRDATQICHIGRQMFPGRSKYVTEAFRDATATPFSYMLIDLKPDTLEEHRLRTGIFPGDQSYAYLPK